MGDPCRLLTFPPNSKETKRSREVQAVNTIGTKLVCDHCNAQVIVTHNGEGVVECHDTPMRVLAGERPATDKHDDVTRRT